MHLGHKPIFQLNHLIQLAHFSKEEKGQGFIYYYHLVSAAEIGLLTCVFLTIGWLEGKKSKTDLIF